MERRDFLLTGGLGGAALAASALSGEALAARPTPAPKPSRGKTFKMTLGCQSGPSSDEHFTFFARYGVTNISARANVAGKRRFPTIDELQQLRAMAERHKLKLDILEPELLPSTHVDRTAFPAIMLADSPERDRDIEAFQTTIRNCARAGIPAVKYNMSLLGVLRTGTTPGRGDSTYSAWDRASARPDTPLTRAGVVSADRFWERIDYFLRQVVPVANEYKVKLACHPHDPGVGPEGYQGINRVLGTIDGLKRFVLMHESPYHGLNFCQGTVSENLPHPGEQVYDVIRWFGQRKKIFNVHFRNIRGGRDHFAEVFPDEGDVDMVRALQTYAEVGYDGMIMPDHVPSVTTDTRTGRDRMAFSGPNAESFAFAYGYIRGLIQSAQRLG